MNNRKIDIIMDLQFGSTGKGLIAGYRAKRHCPDTLVTAWAANAGHTYIDGERKFVHTMLANGIVSPRLERILIGPGSLIDPDALLRELTEAADCLPLDVQILIHPNAAVIDQRHREAEGDMGRIGSTQKGVGEAMIQRIRRNPDDMNTAYPALVLGPEAHELGKYVTTHAKYEKALRASRYIQIEGAQGYSLSIYHGFYPYTTSRDVTTAQVLADCGIPFQMVQQSAVEVIGTVRTFPIRVNNKTGTSGPCFDDQREIDWKELGVEPELTTVTKLPRRVFTFSEQQIARAVRACGVNTVFLNFANYCTENDFRDIVSVIGMHAPVRYLGWGPTDEDVVDVHTVGWNKSFVAGPGYRVGRDLGVGS